MDRSATTVALYSCVTLADQKAKQALTMDSSAQPVSLHSAISRIRQTALGPDTQHTSTAAVYTKYSEQRVPVLLKAVRTEPSRHRP